ncbi:MAG: 50S ribosomal protein L22 [Actinomycetota bacterium]
MPAVKTNERPGTRAQVRYVRMSASKARIVLDLIRNKPVVEASEILTFSERLAAEVIDKCLRSAVANAAHNDEIPAEELYVSACYADEGPTLKRFRPRARGRAGRIHKQTCHITIVVSRYSEDELDGQRAAAEARGESQAASGATRDASADRARRVAKSKAADEPEDTVEDTEATEAVEAESTSDATEVSAEAETSSDEERSDDGASDIEDEAEASSDGATEQSPEVAKDGSEEEETQ